MSDSKILWLPLVSWIIGVIAISFLIFFFYTPSPTITVTYIVIIVLGFYILWRGNEIKNRINKRISKDKKEKVIKNEKDDSALRKRKRRR